MLDKTQILMHRRSGYPKRSRDSNSNRFPIRTSELDRFKFGKEKYNKVRNQKLGTPLCLDIACGAKPFPQANVLCDLNVKPVADRSMKQLVTGGKPFVRCSCYALPFRTGAFDFVTSYYLIEHLADPWGLFRELKRVSVHGYIQSPSWFNEFLYGEDVHTWAILKSKNRLYVKPLNSLPPIHLGFVFHRLYKRKFWRLLHAILDEKFHLFTVQYDF
ncbi:MAG: class I SAM-dependent methyltransferase [Candidatus Bathyarchaeota archaeon]|nr:class I SAM-dependent methyltransferase [Candidatus Bathyarchaeota archaeon]